MKLHITTESEEGQILIFKTFQIEGHHYPKGLMPEDIQKIIDESLVEEKNWKESLDKELTDEAQRLVSEDIL